MSGCFLINPEPLKITVVYVYPLDGKQGFAPRAAEFVASYEKYPPGIAHDTLIVCNGEPAADSSKALFNPLPNVTFINHDNSGWDIGAFQLAARQSSSDMMVFFGSHTYLKKAGWLKRMAEVFERYGNTLYGSTGNQGEPIAGVHPHVRTTAFWCSPKLFARYPHMITQGGAQGQRYEMEHGRNCLTTWISNQGLQPWIVGWDCIYPLSKCDSMPNGFHHGDQSNLLAGDRLTAPPYYHVA